MNKWVSLKVTAIIFLGIFSLTAYSKEKKVEFFNSDFEAPGLTPWIALGNSACLTTSTVHSGRQALEIGNGTIVQTEVQLNPRSTYKLTAWLRIESGSGEVRINIRGLGEHDTGVSSALANWRKVELEFVTGQDRQSAIIQVQNPDHALGLKAWADDISLEYTGKYKSKKIRGLPILAKRIPKTDLGISQQENSKMNWLLDAKFGMFIHWGLCAGPARGEWYMEHQAILPQEYRKLAYPESGDQYFAADKFNAGEWAALASEAGMKYMMLVTMHHDGYALFQTKFKNSFSSEQTHKRDFVKEYVDSCHKYGLKVGLYKTLINWRYPGYYDITGTHCLPNRFGYTTNISHKENARLMKEELYCQVKELMTNYGKIDQIFWDGGWIGQEGDDADASFFWEPGKYRDPANAWPVSSSFRDFDETTGKPLGLMGVVRKYQPDVIVNSRCGWYGDYMSEEGGNAITGPVRTREVWEKCMSMSSTWGYSPEQEDTSKLIKIGQLKRMLADCVIRNMSLLLNVGPDRHGQITKAEQDILRQIGLWLAQVYDAVYGTRGGPWNPKDGEYGFAYKGNTIYIYLLNGFTAKTFMLPSLNRGQKVINAYSVSEDKTINFKQSRKRQTVLTDFQIRDKDVTILAVELNKPVYQ